MTDKMTKELFQEYVRTQKHEEELDSKIAKFLDDEMAHFIANKNYIGAKQHLISLGVPEGLAKFEMHNKINRLKDEGYFD